VGLVSLPPLTRDANQPIGLHQHMGVVRLRAKRKADHDKRRAGWSRPNAMAKVMVNGTALHHPNRVRRARLGSKVARDLFVTDEIATSSIEPFFLRADLPSAGGFKGPASGSAISRTYSAKMALLPFQQGAMPGIAPSPSASARSALR